MNRPSIAVVGSCNLDISASMPRFPQNGETVFGTGIRFGCGGKGFNQAVAAARAGGAVSMIAALGSDKSRETFTDAMKTEGISSEGVCVKEGVSTGTALIEVSESESDNRITVIGGANLMLTAEDVERRADLILGADLLITQLETCDGSVRAALSAARRGKVTTVLNPAPFRALDDGILGCVDYFTPNETEASFYSGITVNGPESAERAAGILMARGVKNVLITLGKRGALFKNSRETLFCEAFKIEAEDTTGAGDCFNGAFGVALASGADHRSALRFACAASALAVSRRGAAEAMPSRSEIDAFLQSQEHNS